MSAASSRRKLCSGSGRHASAPPRRAGAPPRRAAAQAEDKGNQGSGVTVDQLEAVVANAELEAAVEQERSAGKAAVEQERSAREAALEQERSAREAALEQERYINFFLFGGLFVAILSSASPDSFVFRLFRGVLFQVLPK
jgi:hypothetical protein